MEKNTDFADIIARNEALNESQEPRLMTRSDLGAIASLMHLVQHTTYDGDDRSYAAQKLVSIGAMGAIRTLEEMTEGWEQQAVFMAFDIVRDGATAGIVDLSHDYSADPADLQYMMQLHEFFTETRDDFLMGDAQDSDLQEVATLLRTRGYGVDMESVVAYASERGSFSIDGYNEYLQNHVAIREGSL